MKTTDIKTIALITSLILSQSLAFATESKKASKATAAAATVTTPAPAANETEITVEGMHCGGCKKMITKTVCEDKALSEQFESCKVDLVDADKQIGKITVKLKSDKTLDLPAVEAAVKKAGEDYKVIAPTPKK